MELSDNAYLSVRMAEIRALGAKLRAAVRADEERLAERMQEILDEFEDSLRRRTRRVY